MIDRHRTSSLRAHTIQTFLIPALLLLPGTGTPRASAAVVAQDGPPTADALDYGPHPVGFRVVEAYDSTRAFRPARDWRGREVPETARPVQISVWYPAAAGAAGTPMRVGDFRVLTASELDFTKATDSAAAARLRAAFITSLAGFGTAAAEAAALWDAPTPAIRDAPAAPGRYPLVLYLTSAGSANPLLPAYLASHGFAVVSYPANGRMTDASLEFTPNALTLDTDVDDAGFVYAVARRLPAVDASRLALVSFSGASLPALLWQMRDMQADALVALEGWERYRRGVDIMRASVHFDVARARVPFLMLERAPAEASPLYAKVPDVVDSLRYADVTRIAFRDAAHGDFLSHVPGQTDDQPRIYATSARMIRLFLEAHLRADATAAAELARLAPPADAGADFFTRRALPALPGAPTEEELFRLAELDPEAAARAWREARAREPDRPLFREAVIARVALFTADPAGRVVLRALVAEAYPRSIDARVALGEALLAAGSLPAARRSLQEALRLIDESDLDAAARTALRQRIDTLLRGSGGG
jgi:hypothetical protein